MMADTPLDHPSPAWQATMLLRAARVGTLATTRDGQPFASLVTPATAPDRAVLLLVSGLSVHTQDLKRDPRCSLLVSGTPETANPQTTPRYTLTGSAAPIDDPALKSRYLAIHPYAGLYAGFGDFALWRLEPAAGMLVGGFGRAFRLKRAELAPDPAAVAAITAAAEGIMSHCNADHADTMALLAGAPGSWRMVGVDVDGCDLAQGEAVRRIAWPEPAADPAAIRAALVALAHARRKQTQA